MPVGLLETYLKLPVFALVVARLAGMILFQPILGALAVPGNVRALLVLGLAVLITPIVNFQGAPPIGLLGLLIGMAGELMLGALIGLVLVMCLVGVQMGGMLIAQESGLAFGQIANPMLDEEDTVLGAFYVQLAAVLFLIAGGHRLVVSACLDSFASIPLLDAASSERVGPGLLLDALQAGCVLAFHVAVPTLLALFLVNVALAFISRTMPQLNVTTLGFSIKTLIAFALMAISLPAAATAFTSVLQEAMDGIDALIA